MKKIVTIAVSLLLVFNLPAQIKLNETLVFSGAYAISGMMTNLAQLTMSTDLLKTSKKSYLHLSIVAATFQKWDSYFKIRDLYESYVDPTTFKPTLYKRNVYEGGYTKTETYTFLPDGKSIKSVSQRKKGPINTHILNVAPNTLDVVTLIYKLRTVDLSRLQPGQSLAFKIIFDEKEYPVWIKFLGKENVSAGNLGKKLCYKLSILAKTDKLKGKDKNIIWLSADNKKIPCMVEFSIPVGVGRLNLLKAEGV